MRDCGRAVVSGGSSAPDETRSRIAATVGGVRTVAAIAACLVAIAAAGCGGKSSADKAKSQACDARSDIQKQITTLKGLPLATSSIDAAKTAISAIGSDLTTIKDAAPKVGGDLRSQLEQANSAFESAVQSIAQSISASSSPASIASALTTAGTTLETAYRSAFSSVQC